MKKVVVVGATYMDNFGDMLFAKMMADALENKCEFRYYLLSDFARNFVCAERISSFACGEADALIYMPGGFLGDKYDTSLYATFKWFWRYFPIGLKFAHEGKPILVLGVGAGPCKYGVMRMIIKYICKRSKKVVVREQDSHNFLKSIGVDSTVTSDLAQLITAYKLPELNADFGDKKKLLVHVNHKQKIVRRILPAVKLFYENHRKEYSLVIASDQVFPDDRHVFEQFRAFAGGDASFYKYRDPLELCRVITMCDVVITYKLHVGVVACSYGKSVIAVPEHYKKVERYYNQIGYSERVLPLCLVDNESLYNLLNKFYDKPICVPEAVLEAARTNYLELDRFLSELEMSSLPNKKYPERRH